MQLALKKIKIFCLKIPIKIRDWKTHKETLTKNSVFYMKKQIKYKISTTKQLTK